jgi:16S rRNA (guanine1516-N2)-methyltransferase
VIDPIDTPVALWLNDLASHELADYISAQLNIPLVNNQPQTSGFTLEFSCQGVALHDNDNKQFKPLMLDFTLGGAAHRRKFGGGAGQMIAKAVGVSGKITPHIFDATAGLGGDAFVLACLGCPVTLMERSPIAYVLLADALKRARHFAQEQDVELLHIIDRMRLLPGNSIEHLKTCQTNYPVIYLDPMFPERQKTAAVKKEMQFFHALIGKDDDSGELFQHAEPKAWCRLVVKRPRLAPPLSATKTNLVLEGKSCRFDIYTKRKITAETLAESEQF